VIDTLRGLTALAWFPFRARPVAAVAVFAFAIVGSLTGSVMAIVQRSVIDRSIARDLTGVAIALGLAGVFLSVRAVSAWVRLNVVFDLQERTAMLIQDQMLRTVGSLPGIAHHESARFADQLEILREKGMHMAGIVEGIVNVLEAAVWLAAPVAVLVTIDTRLLILPLVGIPAAVANLAATRRQNRLQDAIAERKRAATHLFQLTTTAASGKEIRLLRLGAELMRRHRQTLSDIDREQLNVEITNALMQTAAWLLFAAGFVGAMILVVYKATHGQSSLGSVLLTFLLASQVNNGVTFAVLIAAYFTQFVDMAGRWQWLTNLAGAERRRHPAQLRQAPDRLQRGIRLHAASFRYPEADRDALHDITLDIPAGSIIALVGENGAGKTSLVKLLCGLYRPTVGTITIDGVDIAEMDLEIWRRHLSAGFQDFVRFEFTALETVGVGDLQRSDDRLVVAAALERAAASDVMTALRDGLDTQLGISFADGVELSGGQWQKLALGRAMMREAPLLLLLDEPTASLDAETESLLFDRYAAASRRAASLNGAITVLVSHRFSTVRMADRIAVLDGGRLRELGSHEELMRSGGLYSELFTLQARSYR
jgi:ATP-binding cassette, subfamily B, bacterial